MGQYASAERRMSQLLVAARPAVVEGIPCVLFAAGVCYLRNVDIESRLGVRHARGKSICSSDTAGHRFDDSRGRLPEGEVYTDLADVDSLYRVSVDGQRVGGNAPCVLKAAGEGDLREWVRRASFRLVVLFARQLLGACGALCGVAVVVWLAVYIWQLRHGGRQ